MKICQPHWDRLRDEVRSSGLEMFVAATGEEAFDRVVSSLNDTTQDAKNFDPLRNANFAIWSAFLQDVGVAGLGFEGCPLCEVAKSDKPDLDGEWIRGSVGDQLAYALHTGLVKRQ